MESRNEILRKNLNLLYKTQAAALICLVLAVIPIINLIALVVAFGAAIVGIVALVSLRSIHPDYKNAIIAMIIAFLCQFIFGNSEGMFGEIISAASSIAGLLQTYFIIRATSSLLGEVGRGDLVELGHGVWKITLISVVVSIVAELAAALISAHALALCLLLLVIALILSIVALVKFMGYLKQSSLAFVDQTPPLPEL